MKYILSLLTLIGLLIVTAHASTRTETFPQQPIQANTTDILEEIIDRPDTGVPSNLVSYKGIIESDLESEWDVTDYDRLETGNTMEFAPQEKVDLSTSATEIPPTGKAIMNPTPLPLW